MGISHEQNKLSIVLLPYNFESEINNLLFELSWINCPQYFSIIFILSISLHNFNFEYQKLYIEFSFLYSEHMPLSYLQEENGELQLKHLFIKLHDSLLFS